MAGFASQIALYAEKFIAWLQEATGLQGGVFSIGYTWLVLIFIFFAVLIVGFSLGKSRMLLALVALYIAAFIDSRFVFFNEIQKLFKQSGLELGGLAARISVFILIYAGVLLVLHRSFLKTKLTLSEASILSVVLIGFLGVGFLISIWAGYIADGNASFIPQGIIRYFSSPAANFIWAVLPILGVLLIRKRKE